MQHLKLQKIAPYYPNKLKGCTNNKDKFIFFILLLLALLPLYSNIKYLNTFLKGMTTSLLNEPMVNNISKHIFIIILYERISIKNLSECGE